MGKKTTNYGPDVVFRKLRKVMRYTAITLGSSIVLGLVSGIGFLAISLPNGSLRLVPKYARALLRSGLHKEARAVRDVREINEFIQAQSGLAWTSLWVGVGAAIVGVFVLWFIFWRVGRKNQADKHLRGTEIIPQKKLQKQLFANARFGYLNGHKLGERGLEVPEEYTWRGWAVVGRPGTGKSNQFRIMMKQDLGRKVKGFVVDINGDYWRRFGRPGKDKILSLRHKDSEYWDFKCEDVVPSLLASYLVARSSSGPEFWWKAGRAVLTSLFEYSKDLDEFKDRIAQSDGDILKLLEDNEALASKVLGKEGSQQAAGVLGNTVLDLSFVKDLGYWPKIAKKTTPFSITEWANSTTDDSWVYVIVRDDELEEVRPLLACWFNLGINGCFRRDEDKCYKGEYPSIRFWLDELKTLGRIEEMEKAGERLRKYRASIICGYQNNPQLEMVYGAQGAKNLKDVLQNKAIYSVGDASAQEDLSIYLGEQEVDELTANESYGKRDSDAHSESRRVNRRRTVLSSELGKLPDHHCYVKVGAFDPIKTVIPYAEFPVVNPVPAWEMPPRSAGKKDKKPGPATEGPKFVVGQEKAPAQEQANVQEIPAEKVTEAGPNVKLKETAVASPADDMKVRAKDILKSIDIEEEY